MSAMAWFRSGLSGSSRYALKSLALMPARELVVVVGRQGDHRQDLAGLRVHHDRDALAHPGGLHPHCERIGRHALDLSIDREHQVLAGDCACESVSSTFALAPAGVPSDELRPVRAAQLGLERSLDPVRSDHVVAQVAPAAELGELRGGDGSGVPEDVRQQRAIDLTLLVEVLPDRLDLDHHPWELLVLLAEQSAAPRLTP